MTQGQNLHALEAAYDGPFRFKHQGTVYTIPGPPDLQIYQVIAILETEVIPGTPRMPEWKKRTLFARWCAHYDLPTLQSLQRLVWLVDRYRPKIEVDLARFYNGADLNTLWKQRRFRYLLNLIDHLPRHSFYSDASANDPEHADQLAKAAAERAESGEKPTPPLWSWSPEVDMLAKVVDATRAVNHTLAAVNSPKGKAPRAPEPEPRPKTYLDKAREAAKHQRKKAAHERLVKRILPHKR